MCCFLRFVTCGPAGGLGAPIGSPHASFMGLSEAIFQNWLHLKTCGGAHFLGWFAERGLPGVCPLRGRWGHAQARGGAGCPEQAPARTPRLGPPQLSVCDPEPSVLFILTSPAGLASSLWKDAAKTSFLVA